MLMKLTPLGLAASLASVPFFPLAAQKAAVSGAAAGGSGAVTAAGALLHWADVDGDGRLDAAALDQEGRLRLLRNSGDGRFVDATLEAGLPELDGLALVQWVDVDGDEDPDLFAGAVSGPSVLLRNEGGCFVDVTAESGLTLEAGVRSATWFDQDGDGALDLHVTTATESVLFHASASGTYQRTLLGGAGPGAAAAAPLARPDAPRAPRDATAEPRRGVFGPGGPGATTQVSATVGGTSTTPSAGGTAAAAGPAESTNPCADSVKDQAGLACLLASSTPTYGMLHPLGDDFFIEAGTGNVGIGTTTPFGALHVQGSTFLSGYVYVDGELDGLMALGAWDLSKVGGGLQINETNVDTRLAFAPGGNIGIGTLTPSNRLHMQDGTSGVVPNFNSDLVIESATEASINLLSASNQEASLFFGNPSSGDRGGQIVYNPFGGVLPNGFQFRTGPSETVALAIAETGNVGVGVPSPTVPLDIASSVAWPVRISGPENAGINLKRDGTGSSWAIYHDAADNLNFRDSTTGATRMLITGDVGRVGIGVSSPASALDVGGGISVNNSMVVDGSGNWVGAPIPGGGSVWNVNGSDASYTAGSVGVGTTTPEGLSVTASVPGSFGVWIPDEPGVHAANVQGLFPTLAIAGSGGTSGRIVFAEAGGAPKASLLYDEANEKLSVQTTSKFSVPVLEIRGGADLVEGFDTAEEEPLEPGTVVAIDPERPGALMTSREAYDSKVAGVVSGAGGVSPGIHLGQDGLLDGDTKVAMTGRVYVKASCENGAIRPGDRLTTAALAGHAMKAADPARCDGAVIGKAMSALNEGEGLVLVLVNLQ